MDSLYRWVLENGLVAFDKLATIVGTVVQALRDFYEWLNKRGNEAGDWMSRLLYGKEGTGESKQGKTIGWRQPDGSTKPGGFDAPAGKNDDKVDLGASATRDKSGSKFAEKMKEGMKMFAADNLFHTGSKAGMTGLAQASKSAQLAAVSMSPFEAKMLKQETDTADRLMRITETLNGIL